MKTIRMYLTVAMIALTLSGCHWWQPPPPPTPPGLPQLPPPPPIPVP